jgi:hypothetical protein
METNMPGTAAGRYLAAFLIVCLSHLGLMQCAGAALIDTQTAIQAQDRAEAISSVQAKLGRADVRKALVELGVDPVQAQERAGALSDGEIARLQQQLDQLPAGADGGWILLVIILGVLIYLFASGKLVYK